MLAGYQVKAMEPNKKKWIFPAPRKPKPKEEDQQEQA